MPVNPTHAPDLAAALCSRICHDIANPLGAAANALELLNSNHSPDPDILPLLRQGMTQARNALEISRMAFAFPPDHVDVSRLKTLLADFCTQKHLLLKWETPDSPDGTISGEHAAILLNVILMAVACLPGDGTITVEKSAEPISVSAQGNIRLPDADSPRHSHTTISRHLAERYLKEISLTHTQNTLTISAHQAADLTGISTTPPSRRT